MGWALVNLSSHPSKVSLKKEKRNKKRNKNLKRKERLPSVFFITWDVFLWRRYEQSLSVLNHAKLSKEGMITKSSIMLGLGESDDELKEAMADLRAIDVDILTLGQYLQVCPSCSAMCPTSSLGRVMRIR